MHGANDGYAQITHVGKTLSSTHRGGEKEHTLAADIEQAHLDRLE
jgi:hypothetical protein